MKYLAIIQARCGSSRLPQKVLMDLAGKTVIERVAERVLKSQNIDEAIVATSIEKNNLPLIKICAEKGIRVFVGAENDVLDRYYQAGKLFNPEYVIRVTGDCPVFDPRFLDMAIEQLEDDTDYMAALTETFPDGLDIEIIKWKSFREVWKKARLASEREHVTLYLKNHANDYHIQDLICPIPDIGHLRWTLDEKEDYLLLSKIYDHFKKTDKDEEFLTGDILEFLEKNKELNKINNKIFRNEGLKTSLQNDCIVQNIDLGE